MEDSRSMRPVNRSQDTYSRMNVPQRMISF
jgi:hypothetical protein